MIGPPRRTQRRTHLDASVAPVERALLARADSLEEQADTARGMFKPEALRYVAAEFRALAEELHWWLRRCWSCSA